MTAFSITKTVTAVLELSEEAFLTINEGISGGSYRKTLRRCSLQKRPTNQQRNHARAPVVCAKEDKSNNKQHFH